MTSFAPGTNRDYANAYNNWWFNQNGQGPAPQRSAFGPDSPAGRAQPIQPQSQGTPYGQSPSGRNEPYAAYRPQASPSGQQQGGAFSAYQTPPSFAPGGGQGNFAYAPPDQRPAPFTATTRGPDGQQYDPNQYYPMRDAFIQNINDARAQFVSNPGAGRQPMDFGAMWGRAGDMAQGGYMNPLAGGMGGSPTAGLMGGAGLIGTLGQQAPPSQYQRALGSSIRAWNDPGNPGAMGYTLDVPSAMTPYERFSQDYASGAPLGDPIWETRRRMGQAAPTEGVWGSTNAMPERVAEERRRGIQSRADYDKYLEGERKRQATERADAARRSPPQALPPAYSGRESSAQQAMRGQLLHAAQRDASLNSWQFKNMSPEERQAEMRRREAKILAASPQEIERTHRDGKFATPSKQAQAGYRSAKARY